MVLTISVFRSRRWVDVDGVDGVVMITRESTKQPRDGCRSHTCVLTNRKPETIPCRMINAMILYAYEYMGNCGRLVIHLSPHRCYRTLMGAIHSEPGWCPRARRVRARRRPQKTWAKR